MKTWNYILIAFFSISVLSTQSCNNNDDDSSGPIQNEENSANDDSEPIQNDDDNADGNGDNTVDDDFSLKNLTLYKVEGENIVKQKDFNVTGNALTLQKDIQKHQEIWELTKKIIPLEYRSKMSEFMIYFGDDSDVLGYVVNRSEDLSKWQMGIAVDYAYDGGKFNTKGELAYTLIHEFGHIITLDKTQIDSSIEQLFCSNYSPKEGCSKLDSNINKLYKNHWADIWDEFQNIRTEQETQEFYTTYQKRFVTQYASTNPEEDIAEVFATFTTRAEGVNGTSIAEQKIKIMYDDNEMVKLRNYIRGNISKSNNAFLPAPGTWKRAHTFGDKNKSHCRIYKN